MNKYEEVLHNTLTALKLFSDEIKNVCILHIPHSSDYIPDDSIYLNKRYEDDIHEWTDWYTDKIFDIDGIDKIVVPYSRVWCDVERFEDDKEPMFSIGRGFYYTHDFQGNHYRFNGHKDKIFQEYYLKHHNEVAELVADKIKKYGYAIIIDCHSFADNNASDICIGTDDFHTPQSLITEFVSGFGRFGYSVSLNKPFSGTFVPLSAYKKEENVYSIMIDINKDLYNCQADIEKLNKHISSILLKDKL